MTNIYLNESQTLFTTFSQLVASGIFGILVSFERYKSESKTKEKIRDHLVI